MDVRCERCHTEYELDDGSVVDPGTEVQCTSCGYTFLVRPDGTAAPLPSEAPPPAAEWILETVDGQIHRFRNLTSLQKWIIERKITREDRISRAGMGWRRLGEIVELAPFFDVVDEADRARAAKAGARDLVAEAAAARQAGLRGSPAQGVPTVGGATRRSTPPELPRPAFDASPAGAGALEPRGLGPRDLGVVEAPLPAGDMETHVVRREHGWLKMAVGLGVAGVVAFVGIRFWQAQDLQGAGGGEVARAGGPLRGEPAPAAPVNVNVNVAAPPTVPAPANATAPASAIAAAPAAANAPSATNVAAGAAAVAEPAGNAPAAGAKPAAKDDASKDGERDKADRPAPTYEKLVTDADRALENGSREKASRLYERALELRPTGPEAMTGLGFVMLDRGKADLAVGYFKRAGGHAPAVFGLAEAYRALGETAGAVQSYERYLALSPGGADASAARRQLKTLQARTEPAPSAPRPAAAPAADPNAPPPSPASVLNESAAP
jgi:predicted Zn finger-like uncharacterized protein